MHLFSEILFWLIFYFFSELFGLDPRPVVDGFFALGRGMGFSSGVVLVSMHMRLVVGVFLWILSFSNSLWVIENRKTAFLFWVMGMIYRELH